MNVTYQIMDQMQMLSAGQPASGQPAGGNTGGERSEFESMIQKKYQESQGEADAAKDAGTRQETGTAGKTETPADQQTPEEQQYVLAAALMAACQSVQAEEVFPAQPTDVQAPQAAQAVMEPQMATESPDQPRQADVSLEMEAPAAETQPLQRANLEPDAAAVQPQGEQSRMAADAGETGQDPGMDSKPRLETADAAPAPLFADVKATPVKVAQAPEQPLDVQAEDMAKTLADRVNQAMEQGSSKVEVSLSPRNLGNLTVEITRSGDGTLSVVLSTTTTKAAAVLEQHSSNLQNLLMANTQSQVKVEVHGGQESTAQQFLNPDGQNGQGRQQGQHQEPRQQKQTQDFIQRLRLGLIELDQAVS